MRKLYKNKLFIDLLAATMFFTRIPIKWSFFSDKAPNLTKASWTFPLIGFLIGTLAGSVGDFFIYLGLPIFLSSVIALSFCILLTGAFHEDGLADTSDGIGAGGSPKRIDKIIHDSRLGTYGVIALILGLLIRLGLLLALVEKGYSMVSILAVGFASGTLAIILCRNFFSISKFAKIGSTFGIVSHSNLFLSIIIWAIPTFLIFPFYGILFGFLLLILLMLIIGLKSKKTLGGINGDILGATAFLCELIFLFGIIIFISIAN